MIDKDVLIRKKRITFVTLHPLYGDDVEVINVGMFVKFSPVWERDGAKSTSFFWFPFFAFRLFDLSVSSRVFVTFQFGLGREL